MRATIAITLAMFAATALSACGKGEDQTKAAAGAAPAAAPERPATPTRAEGLWQQTVSVDGGAPNASKLCIDKAVEAKLSLIGSQMADCSKNEVSRNLTGGYSFASVCSLGAAGTSTTKGEAKGDFAKHYEVTAETTTEGAAMAAMNGAHTSVIVAERLGDCPAGWKGGDVEMPGGMKINIIDAMAAMPGRPK